MSRKKSIRSVLFTRLDIGSVEFDPSGRWKILVVAVLFAAVAAVMIVVEIHDHGLTNHVILGLVTGGLIDAALAVAVARRWSHEWTEKERRDTRAAWTAGRERAVFLGMTAGFTATVLRISGVQTVFLDSAIFVLCFGGGILAFVIVFAEKGVWGKGAAVVDDDRVRSKSRDRSRSD